MKISDVISSGLGLGGTIGLIWFRKRLPDYFCRFIELVLIVTADHGPAVAGAHNTIVAARAGKDLISSLCSGLLTIGPRFGGALDGAAQQFSAGYDAGLSAEDFMGKMRREKELIMGIGSVDEQEIALNFRLPIPRLMLACRASPLSRAVTRSSPSRIRTCASSW